MICEYMYICLLFCGHVFGRALVCMSASACGVLILIAGSILTCCSNLYPELGSLHQTQSPQTWLITVASLLLGFPSTVFWARFKDGLTVLPDISVDTGAPSSGHPVWLEKLFTTEQYSILYCILYCKETVKNFERIKKPVLLIVIFQVGMCE